MNMQLAVMWSKACSEGSRSSSPLHRSKHLALRISLWRPSGVKMVGDGRSKHVTCVVIFY